MPRKYFTEKEKKAAHLEAARRYVTRNPEKRAESSKKYAQSHKKETAAATRKRRAANPEKYRKYGREYEKRPRVKAVRQKYYQINKHWMTKRNYEYYLKNKKRIDDAARVWKITNKKEYEAYQRQWAKNNPDKVKVKHIKYRKNNMDKVLYWNSNRRAGKLKRTPKWADLEKIKQVYKKCPEGMVVDHIIPLQGDSVSGLHIATNLQYLSPNENSIKGNRFSFEEYKKTKHYRLWMKQVEYACQQYLK
jgi:hypothetical protein